MEEDVVVPIHVAVAGRPAFASSGGGHFQWMALQHPIANINDVDVLFQNDVAGERTIVFPVADFQFQRRGIRSWRTVEIAGQIISFGANDFAQSAVMNSSNHFDKWRAIADLETHIEAQLALGT